MKTSHVETKEGDNKNQSNSNTSNNNSNDSNNNCYVCAQCNYASDKSANLTRHVRSMHEIVKESLFCCGLKFQSKSDYRDHNKMSHREGHICTVCTKSFSRRALLKRHQSVHTGIKEFKCDYCPYSSSHKSNVVRHLKIHRDLIGDACLEKTVAKKRCHQHQFTHQPEPDSTTMTIPGVANFSLKKKTLKLRDSSSSSNNMETRSRSRKNDSATKIQSQSQNPSGKSNILLQMLSTKVEEEKETTKVKINHSIESILGRSCSSSSSKSERRLKTECGVPGPEVEMPEQLVSSSTSSSGSINGHGQSSTNANSTSWTEERENKEEESNYYACSLRPPSYLLPPIDLSGLAGTNLGTPPFPNISPYAFYDLSSGFGSVIGFEESRYLSSPLVPSHTQTEILPTPSGSLSSFRQTMTSALSQNQSSDQSTFPNPNRMASMAVRPGSSAPATFMNERDYKPVVFGAGLPPYFFATSSPEFSSNIQNLCHPRPISLQVLPEPSSVPGAVSIPGVEYSCAGMRLSFTQVSNAQVTHFVSY